MHRAGFVCHVEVEYVCIVCSFAFVTTDIVRGLFVHTRSYTAHDRALLDKIGALSKFGAAVDVLDVPGLVTAHVLEEHALSSQIRLVGPGERARDAVLVVPDPMERHEAARLLEVSEAHPLLDVARWVPEAAPLLLLASRRGLDLHHSDLIWSELAPWREQMRAWIERVPTSSIEVANVVALGPGLMTSEDARSLLEPQELVALEQSGLGCSRQGGFELNALARRVLREVMADDARERALERIGQVMLRRKLDLPTVMFSDLDEVDFIRRNRAYIEELLHSDTGTREGLERALWATGFMQFLARFDGGVAELDERLTELMSSVSRGDVDPHARLTAIFARITISSHVQRDDGIESYFEDAWAIAIHHGFAKYVENLHFDSARRLHSRGELEEARELLSRCRRQRECIDVALTSFIAGSWLCDSYEEGNTLLDEGLALALELKSFIGEFYLRLHMVGVNLRQGLLKLARVHLEILKEMIDRRDVYRFMRADLCVYQARWHAQVGDPARALEEYQRAHALLLELSSTLKCAQIYYYMAEIHQASSRFERAATLFEQSRALYVQLEHPLNEQRALLAMLNALLQEPGLTPRELAAHKARARDVLSAMQEQSCPHSLVRLRDELSGRLIDGTLRVAADASFFFASGGERVELGHRPVLQRVLRALVDDPGGAAIGALVERAWPKEAMTKESGQNRVRVAISTLRKLGLKGALEFDAGTKQYRLRAKIERPPADTDPDTSA